MCVLIFCLYFIFILGKITLNGSLNFYFNHFLFWLDIYLKNSRHLFWYCHLYHHHLSGYVPLLLFLNIFLAYSFSHSPAFSLLLILTLSLTHSHTHSITHSITHSLTHSLSLTLSLVQSLTLSLTHSLLSMKFHLKNVSFSVLPN